jgi:hypothetical protein
LALLGRLPSARVDGDVMQASEKPAQKLTSRLLADPGPIVTISKASQSS